MKTRGNPTLNIKNYAFHITHFELHLAEIKDKTDFPPSWVAGKLRIVF